MKEKVLTIREANRLAKGRARVSIDPEDRRLWQVDRPGSRQAHEPMTRLEWLRFLGGRPPRLANGIEVHVSSDHFAEECDGIVTKGEYDGGWLYRIKVTRGDRLDAHRNERSELWVCDFEVTPLAEMDLVAEKDGCPDCGERILDRLVWQTDGETVRCEACGREFKPRQPGTGPDIG